MTDAPSPAAGPLRPEPVTLACSDGERLQAHFFPARGRAAAAPVLIAPATGVRQQFYWRFADWLAAQGHPTLVFDYRGIGLSLAGRLSTGACWTRSPPWTGCSPTPAPRRWCWWGTAPAGR